MTLAVDVSMSLVRVPERLSPPSFRLIVHEIPAAGTRPASAASSRALSQRTATTALVNVAEMYNVDVIMTPKGESFGKFCLTIFLLGFGDVFKLHGQGS